MGEAEHVVGGKQPVESANYSMKFPKPRELLVNEYPDLAINQPQLISEMLNRVNGKNKEYAKFLDSSIAYLKEEKRVKTKKVKLNTLKLN